MAKGKLQSIREAIEANDPVAVKNLLTVRQQRFCEEYTVDYSGTHAARRAGYKGKSLDRAVHIMMKHPGIKYYIEHLTRSYAVKERMDVTPDYVIEKAISIIEKNGAKDSDVLRGLELLARHLGMLRDKTEISGPDGGAIEMQQRTQEEAAAVIAALKSMKNKKLKVVGGTDVEDSE